MSQVERQGGVEQGVKLVSQMGEPEMRGFEGLSVQQAKALEVLSLGGTVVAAAKAAGVARQIVHRWLKDGHAFATAYRVWKESLAENARARFLILSDAATIQIAKAISQGDTRTAMEVVKGMGLLAPPPVGPSIMEAVAEKEVRQAAKATREDEFSKYAFTVRDLLQAREIEEEVAREKAAE